MSEVSRSVTRRYDVRVKNGDVRVESEPDGGCCVTCSRNTSSWMWAKDDEHVRRIIEALQDYLIAKHELAAGDRS